MRGDLFQEKKMIKKRWNRKTTTDIKIILQNEVECWERDSFIHSGLTWIKTLMTFYPLEERTNGPTQFLCSCLLSAFHFQNQIWFVKIKSALLKLELSENVVFSVHKYHCLIVCLPVCYDADDNVISSHVLCLYFIFDLCNIKPRNMGGIVTETRNTVVFIGSLIMDWIWV